MWSRRELKLRAKERFKANYWKAVLVALVLVIFAGGSGKAGSGAKWLMNDNHSGQNDQRDHDARWEEERHWFSTEENHHGTVGRIEYDGAKMITIGMGLGIAVAGAIILAVITIIVLIIVIPLQVFLLNPLETGCKRFFLRNHHGTAQVKEVAFAFDNGYRNIVKTLFFRDLYTVLWMLLIIPGIVKVYEYMMIPYLLSENPQMSKEEAFTISKKMMSGNKWHAFVLDLSFLGWYILNIFTLGILGVFYINPYKAQTKAGLYEVLKEQ